ncbi:MAG: hypothetical protein ABSB50_05310 [Terracidiphilus sp.]
MPNWTQPQQAGNQWRNRRFAPRAVWLVAAGSDTLIFYGRSQAIPGLPRRILKANAGATFAAFFWN